MSGKLILRLALTAGTIPVLLLASCASHRQDSGVSAGRPLFRDAAQLSGIRFRHSNGATGKYYYVEATGSGCAFFDYDNDGYLDVLLVQAGPMPHTPLNDRDPARWCRLYHNNGNGTFTDVTKGSGLDRDLGYGQGVAVGDYDNDGYDDLFITGYGGNHLLHNDHGTGKFTDVTVKARLTDLENGPQYATSAAWGDYDNDGYLDLYVCHYALTWRPEDNRICRNPQTKKQDYCTPDLLEPAYHRLYHNNRNGTFTDVSGSSGIDAGRGRGLALTWLDYDEDGRQDIFVANDLTQAFLWHNEGDGHFVNRALESGCAVDSAGNPIAAMGIGIGDYDNSGHESLFVSNFSHQPNTLFRNLGGGTFMDVSGDAGVVKPHLKYLTFGCDFIDYDADGWKDLVVGNGHVEVHVAENTPGTTYSERKQLFHNNGDGKFSEVTAGLGDLASPTVARGLATGDFDNDGRIDILVNNQNGPAQLFHNQDQNGNHWISFKAIGTKSNRDAYGAYFHVAAGSLHLSGSVHSSSSYASHSDSRVYFGLGNRDRIDTVQIHWPSGQTDTIKDLSADRIYVVTEGRGVTGFQPTRGEHSTVQAHASAASFATS